MATLVSWDDLLHARPLPAGDRIRLTATPRPTLGSGVGFVLRAAPSIAWEKRLRFFGVGVDEFFLRTRDAERRAGPLALVVSRFDARSGGTLRLELVKAMAFGTLTGVYEVTDVGRWKGNLLDFLWLQD